MKSFLKSLKQQDGFTLVELMVVVAIIGVLSAVAIPNFKKYQAKAKISEAKLQLSGLYMAESSFYSDYNFYAGCLPYMGFNPTSEVSSRFYALGFATAPKAPIAAYNSATTAGLPIANITGCPQTPSSAEHFFPAGKGAGAIIATATAYLPVTTTYDTINAIFFTAGAGGVIDGSKTTSTDTSALTINEAKLLKVVREGY